MHLNAKIAFFIISVYLSIALSSSKDDNDEQKSITTSVAGMEQLLSRERTLLNAMEMYAKALENKAELIRSAILTMREENNKSVKNPEEYLGNPINAFALIRRMYADWVYWELFVQQPLEGEIVKIIQQERQYFPTDTDFQEAIAAISRLQQTYGMKAADIAVGILDGKQYDVKFSTIDTFAIGYELFNQQQYFEASFWLYTALQKYEEKPFYHVFGFSRRIILALYAETLMKQNRAADAIMVLDQALLYHPGDAKLINRKKEFELKWKTEDLKPIILPPKVVDTYQHGCRGKFLNTPSQLHCRYNSTNHPFLKLAPLKMEEVSLKPYMILYHDVISDNEIITLKELAKPGLKRATVYSEEAKKSVVINRRTSKFSWFPDDMNQITRRLNRRIADMSGFELKGSEMLQVMNYGLGGHYDTHFDFFNLSATDELTRENGDRKSTVLFYLSDVEKGGATVFPEIQKTVYPQKGTAVMWYNLNNRGEADGLTLHAACPVIVGSKWVCNKWIRQRNQFLKQPCYKE